jgi:glycosyltransferase involved in cell wall biosynthesis
MEGISIVITLKNRAHLLKYALESIHRQEFIGNLEVCIADGGSTDNLLSIIDSYSEMFPIKFAVSDRHKSYIPIQTNNPAADLNAAIRYMPTYNTVLKMDPEIILKDTWLLEEVSDLIAKDSSCTYNARCHFTEGDNWYMDYDDIIRSWNKHYHFAEGGPFSRSKYYFCSTFDRSKFIELGGIEELMVTGAGYDDDCFREMWKNKYGHYEHEITAQVIHLWHPSNVQPSQEESNRRVFERIKDLSTANTRRICNDTLVTVSPLWGNVEMLSKVYTIKDGYIIKEEAHSNDAVDLDLPFTVGGTHV